MEISLTSFLMWIVAGGSVVAVSWWSERSVWFQALQSETKKWVQYGVSASLGILALLIQQFVPASVLYLLTPYFAILAGVFGMVFLNQLAHTNDPARWKT
jgi:hypothetical protein